MQENVELELELRRSLEPPPPPGSPVEGEGDPGMGASVVGGISVFSVVGVM